MGWLAVAFLSFLGLLPVTMAVFCLAIACRDRYEDPLASNLDKIVYGPGYLVTGVSLIVLDPVFNTTWGSLLFRERPHEWLFTSRVERHYRTCDYAGDPLAPAAVYAHTSQQRTAVRWARWLNRVDRHHVTMHKG